MENFADMERAAVVSNSEEVKIANLLSKIGDFLVGDGGFVCITALWAVIKVQLGQALAGNRSPDGCI